jgi:hypothetical protein
MKFPKGKPVIENTNLEFINLDKVLTASQRERAHRISGYISIEYHDALELIFLKQGEPFNAARITQEERKIVPIREVIDKAKKASYGILAEYSTDETLLNLIISSITLKPIKADIDFSKMQPKIFIDKLKAAKFNGFILVKSGVGESFIHFNHGEIVGCYVAGSSKVVKIEEIINFLTNPKLKFSIYDRIEEFATAQATPAQFDMFCKLFSSLLKGYAFPLGQALVIKTAVMAKSTAQKDFSFIEQCKIGSDLSLSGNVVVEPKILAQGMARWFDLLIESFSTLLGDESEVIARQALHDYRFALKSLKFFEFSKLKI